MNRLRSIRSPRWWREDQARTNVLMSMLMLVLAFIFMSPGLPPGRVPVPMEQLLIYPPWHSVFSNVDPFYGGGDPILQQLPWRHWAQQELAAGRFPLWASSPFGGMPLFASMQPSVLYPLHLLWVLMPVGAGAGIIMALKLWLAGLGMWGFLRAMNLHPAAAGLSSIGFMFCAPMVEWLPWNNSSVYLLLPWISWAVYAWCRQGHRLALALLAALFVFAIFGGHPETLFNMGVVTALWALGLIVTSNWRQWGKQIAGLGISLAVAIGIGAIQMLPFLQIVGLSHEGAVRANSTARATMHLGPDMMLTWLLPRSWGQMGGGVIGGTFSFYESNGYVGLVAFVGLVLVGVGAARRNLAFRNVVPWILIGAFSWVVTYDNALGTTIRMLPVFNQSIDVRWVWMVAFVVLVASAFGWDWLARGVATYLGQNNERSQRHERLLGAGLSLLAMGGIVMLVHAAGVLPQPVLEKPGMWYIVNGTYALYWLVWVVGAALAVLGASMLWASGGRFYQIGPVLLGLLLVLDLWRLLFTVNSSAPSNYYFPETRFLRDLENIPSTERLIIQDDTLIPNSGMVYAIRDWRAQDPLISERAYRAAVFLDPGLPKHPWDEYNMLLRNVRLQVAPMLGMRYYVSSSDPNTAENRASDQPPITRLAYKEKVGLWRIEGVPGFAYLSDNVQAVAGEKAAEDWMKGLTWTQVRTYAALVEAPVDELASVHKDPAGSSPGGVQVLDYTPGHIRLESKAVRSALLVVAESWYPGWQVTIDGQPAKLLRANYLSQGVLVPQGTHTVEMEYRPDAFVYGAAISAVSSLGFVGLLLWGWRPWVSVVRRRKVSVPAPGQALPLH